MDKANAFLLTSRQWQPSRRHSRESRHPIEEIESDGHDEDPGVAQYTRVIGQPETETKNSTCVNIEEEECTWIFPPIQYNDDDDDGSAPDSSHMTEDRHPINGDSSHDTKTQSVCKQIEKVVMLLKAEFDSDFWDLTRYIATYIYYPYHTANNELTRRQYGDCLARLGGGKELTWFLTSMLVLIKDADKTERAWNSIHIVQNTCWDYSNCSLALCKQFGECGLLSLMVCYLKKYRLKKNNTMDEQQFMISALNILHNCSKIVDNTAAMKDLSATKELSHFVVSSDQEIIMLTLLTLSYIVTDARRDILKVCDSTMEYMLEMLRTTTTDSRTFIGRSREGKFSAVELLKGFCNLARHTLNKESFVRLGITPLLVKLMTEGQSAEQKMATYLVHVLLRLKENRQSILDTEGLVNIVNKLCKNDNLVVRETAEKTLIEIMKPSDEEEILSGPSRLVRKNAVSSRRRSSYIKTDAEKMMLKRRHRSHSLGWIHE